MTPGHSTPATPSASDGLSTRTICWKRLCCRARCWALSGRTGRPSPSYRSVVRRRLTKLAIFLLLGAVLIAAVAWAWAVWADGSQGENAYGSTTTSGGERSVWVFQRPGVVRVESLRLRVSVRVKWEFEDPPASGVAPYWENLATPTAALSAREGEDWRIVEGRGWPVISLWYMSEMEEPLDWVRVGRALAKHVLDARYACF